MAVKRSVTVRTWPLDVTSYTAVPVMIAGQPSVRGRAAGRIPLPG